MIHEVELLDGEVKPYAANIIAENIWSQVDPEGQRYVIFESIIDHHIDSTIAVSKANMYLLVNRRLTIQKSTAGVKLLVLCKDRSEQWFPLNNLKKSNPIECAEYAESRKIDTEPTFCWWVPYTLKKKEMTIATVRSQLKANTHKYGIKVPRDVAHAYKLDAKNGNTL